jgi:HSP20 family protein
MSVTDLIHWRAGQRTQPVSQSAGDPVALLQSSVNRAFDDFLRMFPTPLPGLPGMLLDNDGAIQVDIADTNKEIRVTAELPGVEEGDIEVRVSDGMLTISAEKKAAREENESGYILRERSFGRVERPLPLPAGVNTDAAQATFKGGVLTVTIPKVTEARDEAKRVPVQSS